MQKPVLDAATLEQKRLQYQKISSLLMQAYGYPAWRQHLPPVDELVCTILSQATSDGNRDRGFFALKEKYPDWDAVRTAPVSEIQKAIHSAGLSNMKAPRIQQALQYIQDHRGEINLDFLATMDVEEARAWLTQIEGIGLKTASIILLFCYNKAAFPVDTHVHRVTGRLGLIDGKTDATKAHFVMEQIAPSEHYYADHLNIIRHGREICKAQKPRCGQCFLREVCDYYQTLADGESE